MNTIEQTLQDVYQMVEEIGNEMLAEFLESTDVFEENDEEDNLPFELKEKF